MVAVMRKSLWAHKRRMVGTLLAVLLGVAFLSGTLVLGDTLRSNFDVLFADANAGTDVVVRSASTIDASRAGPGGTERERGLVDAGLAQQVGAVEGVARAVPTVSGTGQIIGKDGKGIGGNGPPTLAGNWVDDPDLNPYRLVEGRAPATASEVVINRGAAKAGHLRVGDTTTVQVPQPVTVTIVGIATFGKADGLGASTYAGFTLDAAERYLTGAPGRASAVSVKAAPGVSQAELVSRIRAVLPLGAEAITGKALTEETTSELSGGFLRVFTSFLTVFAGIALLVATFSIHNTFSILVAQRTRESALLRALGAARAQVLAWGVAEALAVGVVASAAGLAGGVAVAGLLKGLFDGFGFSLPAGGLVFRPSTVAISLAVGVVVTFLAGIAPAMKASRVAPLAALRDIAVDHSGASLARTVAGIVLTAAGVVVVLTAVVGGGSNVLARAGAGAVLTIVGVVVFGPVVARPASAVVGWPLARWRGVTGALARNNAMRNPRRTSGTAAALMVGVAVVTLFTVFGASIKASLRQTAAESFGGDLVVRTGSFGAAGLSPQLADDISRLPEVSTATGLGQGVASIGGKGEPVTVVDPARIGKLLDLHVVDGSVATLGDDQLAVSDKTVKDKGWRLGTPVPVTFVDGSSQTFTVGAVFTSTDVAGSYLVPRAAWAPHAVQPVDRLVLVDLKGGVGVAAGKAAVERVAQPYGDPLVQDRDEYLGTVAEGVNLMLGIVYVLLALAIVIALMGIANTLTLAIHERTRELGLLRAVGETRGQLRAMVRSESVVIALFGTVGGLSVGLFLGWALVRAASAGGIGRFALPGVPLVVVVVAGAVAGVLAGLRPARRAASLDVLAAIAAE
jgi:putative ABC transport system permease protein